MKLSLFLQSLRSKLGMKISRCSLSPLQCFYLFGTYYLDITWKKKKAASSDLNYNQPIGKIHIYIYLYIKERKGNKKQNISPL